MKHSTIKAKNKRCFLFSCPINLKHVSFDYLVKVSKEKKYFIRSKEIGVPFFKIAMVWNILCACAFFMVSTMVLWLVVGWSIGLICMNSRFNLSRGWTLNKTATTNPKVLRFELGSRLWLKFFIVVAAVCRRTIHTHISQKNTTTT